MTVLSRPQGLTSLLMGRLGNALLWLLAAVHVAAIAVLLLSLMSMTSANAAEQPATCGGSDILAQMKEREPQTYAAIVAEAQKTPKGVGTFFTITKDGKEPSWLLGTMHISDPRILKMPKGAKEAFARAGTVIVESDEITSEQKASAALLARPDLTMFTDGTSITDLLSKDDINKLEAGLQSRGIPLSAVMKMKPWILSSFVALPACEFARKAKGDRFLDMALATDAVSDGKTLVGLETLVEQMNALADLPMSFHIQSLIEMLQLGDRMEDVMATMIDLYLKGEVGMITPMMNRIDQQRDAAMEEANAAFEKRIITDRNHVMADRAAPHLEGGGVFMAIGALHLPGKEGVIELLRQKGFTVTAAH